MFEFSLLSPAKEERPASSGQSAVFGKIRRNSSNLAGMILHNSVIFWEGSPFLKLDKLGLHFEILHRPVVASVLMNFQTQMRLYDKHVMFCGGSVVGAIYY